MFELHYQDICGKKTVKDCFLNICENGIIVIILCFFRQPKDIHVYFR